MELMLRLVTVETVHNADGKWAGEPTWVGRCVGHPVVVKSVIDPGHNLSAEAAQDAAGGPADTSKSSMLH
jgi:hypothetical protein